MGGASSSTRLLRRAPYDGKTLGIVIGIDVGTTYSGVSYAILRPGEIPDIVSVPKCFRLYSDKCSDADVGFVYMHFTGSPNNL